MTDPRPDDTGRADVEDLLSQCIEAAMDGRDAEVDELLEAHPGVASEVRETLRSLEGLDLLRDAPSDTGAIPDRVGDYEVLRRIGSGGMGVVYLARQTSVKRLVALKVLHPAYASSPKMAERLRREAQAIGKLHHPHIVNVYDCGESDGLLHVAMELVVGQGLDQMLATSRPEIREAVRWIRDVARALECAHQEGVLHRDVKPSNIQITANGRAVLVDFGLARDVDVASLTMTGAFQGSPYYASPEQIDPSAGSVGPPSDVYSLGVTLFEAVSGRVPFAASTTQQVFQLILNREPPRPRALNPRISRDLETVILTAMAREPGRRYASAAEFADDLDSLLGFHPIRARPPSLLRRGVMWARRNRAATAAALVVVLCSVAFWIATETRRIGEARRVLAEAASMLDEYRTDHAEFVELEKDVAERRKELIKGHHPRPVWEQFEADAARLKQHRGERENKFTELLLHLDRAGQLGAPGRDVGALRAEAYLERWREARGRGDQANAAFYRAKIEQDDPEGRLAQAFVEAGELMLVSEPPGAAVYLFRYREMETGMRVVPAPLVESDLPVTPGTWCLRVARPAGGIESTDIIYEVAGSPIEDAVLVAEAAEPVRRGDRLEQLDGQPVRDMYDVETMGETPEPRRYTFSRAGERFDVEAVSLAALGVRVAEPWRVAQAGGLSARVFRFGKTFTTELPEGLVLRPTGAPLLPVPGCSLGRTPVTKRNLEAGSYVALVVAPDHEPVRCALLLVPSKKNRWFVRPPRAGTSPPGFAPITAASPGNEHEPPFWMLEHEVTSAEYLEFLNSPDTLDHIRSEPQPTRYPREPSNAVAGGYWERNADGTYRLPAAWPGDWPVLGVSWHDASAYARWRTGRAAEQGEPWEFSLPLLHERQLASGWQARISPYPWGREFRPQWCKSCGSRPVPCREPVMRFPLDESPFGVYDLSGGAQEWNAGWYWPEQRQRPLFGGSWGHANPEWFLVQFGRGDGEDATADFYGIRLVARRLPRNLAYMRAARQSSGPTDGGPKPLGAVDGMMSFPLGQGCATQTAVEDVAWWEVDLGVETEVERIAVYVPPGDEQPVPPFDVLLGSEPLGDAPVPRGAAGVRWLHSDDRPGRVTTLRVATRCRYVRVQLRGRGALKLAEVEVY